jgi:hydroxymethylbilane synthase
MKLRIATRGSALARWQAEHVATALRGAHPDLEVELVLVQTTGDSTSAPLSSIGTTGLFTREVDRAVLDDRADAAVHSLKDLPTVTTDGLHIAAIPQREDPRDAFVPAPGIPGRVADLPAGARIGTSALRRRALLLEQRPDLHVLELRGNVDTRLAKLASSDIDGAILAFAGLRRLGRADVAGEILDATTWLPAPGQGALAIVTRIDDTRTARVVGVLDDAVTRSATSAERTLLRVLEGGCHVPIGALATVHGDRIALAGFVASPDGARRRRGSIAGPALRAAQLGEDLADALLHDGADEILRDAKTASMTAHQ